MSWSLSSFLGDAEEVVEHDFTEFLDKENLPEREQEILAVIEKSIKEIVAVFGGHVSVSAYGHTSPLPTPGDSATINISYVPKPDAPTLTLEDAPVEEPAATPISPVDGNTIEPAPLTEPDPDPAVEQPVYTEADVAPPLSPDPATEVSPSVATNVPVDVPVIETPVDPASTAWPQQ
jgi:hypothetical protein